LGTDGRTDGHLRPTLLGQLEKVDLKIATKAYITYHIWECVLTSTDCNSGPIWSNVLHSNSKTAKRSGSSNVSWSKLWQVYAADNAITRWILTL